MNVDASITTTSTITTATTRRANPPPNNGLVSLIYTVSYFGNKMPPYIGEQWMLRRQCDGHFTHIYIYIYIFGGSKRGSKLFIISANVHAMLQRSMWPTQTAPTTPWMVVRVFGDSTSSKFPRTYNKHIYTHTLHARIVYKVCTLINASDMRLHYTKHPSASGYCCLAISTHPRWLGWLDPSELLLEYVFSGDPDESHQSSNTLWVLDNWVDPRRSIWRLVIQIVSIAMVVTVVAAAPQWQYYYIIIITFYKRKVVALSIAPSVCGIANQIKL